jgi:hypothetical protein
MLLRDATRVGMSGSSMLSKGGLEGHVGRIERRSLVVRRWVGWRSYNRSTVLGRGRDAIRLLVVVMLLLAWWVCLRVGENN